MTRTRCAPSKSTLGACEEMYFNIVHEKDAIFFRPHHGPSAYMRHYTRPTLVQIMACCCLCGVNPLSEQMMDYWQKDISKQILLKTESKKKMNEKKSSANWRSFCSGLNVLILGLKGTRGDRQSAATQLSLQLYVWCQIPRDTPDPGGPFTNYLLAHYWKLMKIIFAIILIPVMNTGHKFTNSKTTKPTWHGQNWEFIVRTNIR